MDETSAATVCDPRVDLAVEWILKWWLVADKREALAVALRQVITRDLAAGNFCLLYIDYDPLKSLLEAVHLAGVECRGFLFSARGLFVGEKCGVRIDNSGVRVKLGYGCDWDVVAPAEVLRG